MGVKGTVTDDSTGKAVPNALIQTTNVTRIGKGQRRSDLINHDVTSGKFTECNLLRLLKSKE